MKHEGWTVWGERLGVPVTSDQAARLDTFEALLIDHAVPMGMVAPSDLPRLRERHVLDCLRGAAHVGSDEVTGVDLGSGAGLPGIVIAIVRPELRLVLAEVRRNRASFLERSVAELALGNVRVHGRRLETLRERVDVCTARAFAPPLATWEAAERLLRPDGRLIYWAGERFASGTDVPEGVRADLFPAGALARSGPLVIMTRQ